VHQAALHGDRMYVTMHGLNHAYMYKSRKSGHPHLKPVVGILSGWDFVRWDFVLAPATHITVDNWETLAQYLQQWRQAIHKGKSHIEEKISQKYQHDHNLRHDFPDASAPTIFCVNGGRRFKSQIGLFSHQRAKHVTDETLH